MVAVHKISVALDRDHQGGTSAYEDQQAVPLQLDAIEKIEPA